MKYPYAVSSDQHCHSWSQFSTTDSDGVNSRLNIILKELDRSYDALHAAGGNQMFLAGDLFHVRGKLEPSVFNPTVQRFTAIHDKHDVYTVAIPGNHDLEGKTADTIGNAMQSLGTIDRFTVNTNIEYHPGVIVFPWFQDLSDLRARLASQAMAMRVNDVLEETDVIIHAPVNGVIKGIPDHGLEAEELAAYGFRRVFAGHYHDHKVFCDGKVISIGATTHQTWNDPGTKAGFLLVYEDHIEHVESLAPKFIDFDLDKYDGTLDHLKGNYVRAKLIDVSDKEIKEWRKDFEDAGAIGVNIIATKASTTGIRSGATAKSVTSLDASVQHYIVSDMNSLFESEVKSLAQQCLDEART